MRMPREPKPDVRSLDAKFGSESLLRGLEHQFSMFSRKHSIDYLDARTLLMNATGL